MNCVVCLTRAYRLPCACKAAYEFHRPHDVAVVVLGGRKRLEGRPFRSLDVERYGAGEVHGLLDRRVGRAGDYLQVNEAAVLVPAAKQAGDGHQAVHREIRVAHDAARKEDAVNPLPPHVFHENVGHFFGREGVAARVVLAAERAVAAVVRAGA